MSVNAKKGFTLVELIVVIAIIGILTTVVIGSTTTSRAEARDQRRQADIKEIQIDLAEYHNYYGSYPNALSDMNSFILGGSGNIPTDPATGAVYYYAPVSSGGVVTSYCIGTNLELAVPTDNVASCNPGVSGNPDYMQNPPQ